MQENIIVKGAKENNLKNIDVVVPRNKFVVFSGVSGSGKSTLAFDTIYAEGQRRFMESLSSYARMFLGQANKPDVESIEGLSPSISIDQKTTSHNPRSTVGTVTEIYDYLRLLYARIGIAYCPHCHKKIEKQTVDEIVDKVLENSFGEKVFIESPIVRNEKGTQVKLIDKLKKEGYVRAEIDGEVVDLYSDINLDKNRKHYISAVVDRLILKEGIAKRLTEAIENAIKLSNGLVEIKVGSDKKLFNTNFSCSECGFSIEEISPRMFSFNNPLGACDCCLGLGKILDIDEGLVLKNSDKSINHGAFNSTGWNVQSGGLAKMYFVALSKRYKFSLDVPVKDLDKKALDIILYGNNGEKLVIDPENTKFNSNYTPSFEGLIPNLKRRYKETKSEFVKFEINKLMSEKPCHCCKGTRLNNNALSIKINGLNIAEFCDLSIKKAYEFLNDLKLSKTEEIISKSILKEVKSRLKFLLDVGLDYLSLSRTSETLSGGESQRIRLATQIGSGLTGVLYVLDEPSIGLHQRDNDKLIATLKNLRDLGNSLIVVEHDEDTINSSDYVIDIGPKAGVHGGEVVATGTPEDIKNNLNSITGDYLSGRKKIEIPSVRRKLNDVFIEIKGAKQNNLKNIDVKIPSKVFTCITGVSGSGKSSLINEVLLPVLSNKLNKTNMLEGAYDQILGTENFDKVISIDQSPIGKTPRSNPATYTGVFNFIRDLFASTPEAKERGYSSGRFSFNVSGGRCEACEGNGIQKIEMFFLPDVFVPCEVCKAKRYNRETLEVKYKGKNIFDVLDMTVEDALLFFENLPQIKNKIQALYDVGLSYIKLGQSATTLSGGEAQRVKLATELSKRSTGKTVYILDEPTTGLHSDDVKKLIEILQKLVSLGNTVIVIEHNLDVIKVADYIIDLGPEGGDKGGQIVATGTPEELAKVKKSYTGQFLKKFLSKN